MAAQKVGLLLVDRVVFYRWLGDVVRAAREHRKITQAELAKAVGIEGQDAVVCQIETGRIPVPLARAEAFEKALDLPEGFLLEALVNFRARGGGPEPFQYLRHWRSRFGDGPGGGELYARLVALPAAGGGPVAPPAARSISLPVSREPLRLISSWTDRVRRRVATPDRRRRRAKAPT